MLALLPRRMSLTSTKYVIDAWAWLEYLDGTAAGTKIDEYLKKGEAFTNTVTIAEVVSRVQRRGMDANVALTAIGSLSRIVGINTLFAKEVGLLHAAMKKNRPNFSFGDSFALYTAKSIRAKVLTVDPDFKGLREAEMIKS